MDGESSSTCPKFGGPLAEASSEGLCRRCLVEFALFPPTLEEEAENALGQLGDYEILERIGQGGMGTIYRALQGSLNREVAIKLIPEGRLAGETDLARFQVEAMGTVGGAPTTSLGTLRLTGGDNGSLSSDFSSRGATQVRVRIFDAKGVGPVRWMSPEMLRNPVYDAVHSDGQLALIRCSDGSCRVACSSSPADGSNSCYYAYCFDQSVEITPNGGNPVTGTCVQVSVFDPLAPSSTIEQLRINGGGLVELRSGSNPQFFDVFVELSSGGAQVLGSSSLGEVSGHLDIPAGSTLKIGSLTPQSGSGLTFPVGSGLIPPSVVPSTGYVSARIMYEFDQPMVFTPDDGSPSFLCTALSVAGATLDNINCKCYEVETNLPAFALSSSELVEKNQTRISGRGKSNLLRVPTSTIVSNIGSSGLDGVSLTPATAPGSCRCYGATFDPTPLQLNQPSPPQGFPFLKCSAVGLFDGTPNSSLGESSLSLAGGGGSVELFADYSAYGNGDGELKVIVVGKKDQSSPPNSFIIQGDGVVCQVFPGPVGASVDGAGHLAEQSVPGFSDNGPGYYWSLDQDVEVTLPGGAQGSGISGDVIYIFGGSNSQRAGGFDTEMISMNLTGTHPQLNLTGDGGLTESTTLDQWALDHFTPAQIDALVAAGFNLDIDGDKHSELDELSLNLDPHVMDGHDRRSTLSRVVVPGQLGAPDETFLTYAYQLSPSASGVEVNLRTSDDLRTVNTDPSQFTLLQINQLANGNREFVYQLNESVGQGGATRLFVSGDKKHKHRGHVTILK